MQRFKKASYTDECNWILNMKLNRGKDSNGQTWVELNQELAITKIAQAAGLLSSRQCATPTLSGEKLHATQEGDKPPSESWSYPSILGGVLYVANLTRPDIAFAANRLTRYLRKPNDTHCQALKRLVRYMYTTKHIGIRYTSGSHNPFRLTAAADASFADCEDTHRSTLGWCQWLGDDTNGSISWGSRIGKNVALSTTESEVQAALELLKDVLWTRDFLAEVGYQQTGSTRILEDNNGCLGQSNATKGLRRARHYLVALGALNEAVHAGDVHLHRVDSDKNRADQFTKGLGKIAHLRLGSQNLGVDLEAIERKCPSDENATKDASDITATADSCEKEGEHSIEIANANAIPCAEEGEHKKPLANANANAISCEKQREHKKPSRRPSKTLRQRIIDGEWMAMMTSHLATEKEGEKPHDDQLDIDERFESIHLAKQCALEGNESAFHMFYKLAQLEHYVRRDTPRRFEQNHTLPPATLN